MPEPATYTVNQRVELHSTGGELDAQQGVILGRAATFADCDFYIVGLDDPTSGGDLAIQITQACIRSCDAPVNPLCRQLTVDEVRDRFLNHVKMLIEYWQTVPVHNILPEQNICDRRVQGVAFSILSMLDGSSDLPGFIVAPAPHPSDQSFDQANGSNWYPQNHNSNVVCDISGDLHHQLFNN